MIIQFNLIKANEPTVYNTYLHLVEYHTPCKDTAYKKATEQFSNTIVVACVEHTAHNTIRTFVETETKYESA